MCPACMTTAALLATGTTTAGGLIGFLAVKLRKRDRAPTGAGRARKSGAARAASHR